MTIYPDSIGEINADGTVKIEAVNCALTDIPLLNQHHVKHMLDATHYVRVTSPQYPNLTEDVQAELLASIAPKPASKKAAEAAKEA